MILKCQRGIQIEGSGVRAEKGMGKRWDRTQKKIHLVIDRSWRGLVMDRSGIVCRVGGIFKVKKHSPALLSFWNLHNFAHTIRNDDGNAQPAFTPVKSQLYSRAGFRCLPR